MEKLIKGIFSLLLFSLFTTATAETYYVSPNGTNGLYPNRGTLNAPWATFQWAFDHVTAGDTVYFRGGIYYQSTAAYKSGLSGTANDPIVFMAYPGDLANGNRPIIDGNNSSNNGGIMCASSNHLKFYGITIRKFVQINPPNGASYDQPYGFYIYRSSNIIIENCICHNIQYRPYWIWESDEVYLINCDSHDIYDPLSDDPGDHADGFFVWDGAGVSYPNYRVYLWGCRAWNIADNGFDLQGDFYIEAKNCWSFNNGHVPGFEYGRGSGFNYGYAEGQQEYVTRKISNCVAAFNNSAGFVTMDWYSQLRPHEVYNCISYHNGYPSDADGIGISIFNTSVSDYYELQRVYRNNIAYDNEDYDVLLASGAIYTHSNNSWDITSLTITDADFVSLDSTGITAPRQTDGSFPNNDCYIKFLHLASTSALIDAGTDVGVQYDGKAPDLGAFESLTNNSELVPVTNIIITSAGAATTITTNAGSLQLSAAILPANATNKSLSWSMANGTGQATISSSGLVTATANGTVTAKATANDGSSVYGTLIINISNQVIKVASITVTGAAGATAITTNTGSLQLSAAISPTNATNKSVTWSIANGTGQANISSSGLVTAVGNGTVTARATANDGSGAYGTLVINISNQAIKVASINVTGAAGATTITTNAGSLQLSAAISPTNATNKSVTWSIANGTGQASISSSGLVTAVANGTVTARATANDGSGVYGTLLITVSNQGTPPNQPPTVLISSPTKSTSYIAPATMTIEAAASDPDGTVIKVEFYQGTTKLGELTAPPYSFTWKEVPEGAYSITAIATDNQNLRTTSGAVTVIVEKSVSVVNELPIVSINSPNKDKKIKKNDNVLIEVVATDPDGTISKVELKNGEITLAELTTPPFNYLWENVDTGNYFLTAIATDNQGAKNTSAALELKVVNSESVTSALINLYPNPTNGDFSVSLDFPFPDSRNVVSIVNLSGHSVYNETWQQDEIMKHFSLPGLLPGSYIILIKSGDGIITSKKFIKK